MDEILHHPRNRGKPVSVGVYRGIIIPGFVEVVQDFVHPLTFGVDGPYKSELLLRH